MTWLSSRFKYGARIGINGRRQDVAKNVALWMTTRCRYVLELRVLTTIKRATAIRCRLEASQPEPEGFGRGLQAARLRVSLLTTSAQGRASTRR